MSWNDVTQNASDSIGLNTIDGTPFTLVEVEDSAYTAEGKPPVAGVKLITAEQWENANGEMVSKLHTTRVAIVNKTRVLDADGNPANLALHKALADGKTFRLVCPKEKAKSKSGGKSYFDLIEATE